MLSVIHFHSDAIHVMEDCFFFLGSRLLVSLPLTNEEKCKLQRDLRTTKSFHSVLANTYLTGKRTCHACPVRRAETTQLVLLGVRQPIRLYVTFMKVPSTGTGTKYQVITPEGISCRGTLHPNIHQQSRYQQWIY